MIITEFRCNRCGKTIEKEKVNHYGSLICTITDNYLFLIKHHFTGGEKDVHRWRSAIFCEDCTKKLEKVYKAFIEGKKNV